MKRDRDWFDAGALWLFCMDTRLIVCRPLFWFAVLVVCDMVSVLFYIGYFGKLQ